MELHARHLIAGATSSSGDAGFRAYDPERRCHLDPEYRDATPDEVDRAVARAGDAAGRLATGSAVTRAALLERIATGIEELGDALIDRTRQESGLPVARLLNERGRTVGQLRTFAALLRDGSHVDARIDHAEPDRAPIPKPDMRQMSIPIGPIAVFGASNFPLAFSTAGGDTAAALAAGCPVIVKGHPAHPGCGEMVGRVIAHAVTATDLPPGTFSLLHGHEHGMAEALVQHPGLRGVAFTGSLTGGRALFDLAQSRPDPIPVFAEMGSFNPVFVLPGALAERGEQLARGIANAVTLGVGQFCTNPGVIVVERGAHRDDLVARLTALLDATPAGVTLHPGIAEAYRAGLARLRSRPYIACVTAERRDEPCRANPTLLTTTAEDFVADPALREEVFGPVTVLVTCADREERLEVAEAVPGQLTATLHGTAADLADHADLIDILRDRVGRLICNGYPTGLEVCPSTHHGGPYPATTDARWTSVGTAAIRRFLRPICYQDWPHDLLPPELRDDNPLGIVRLVNGATIVS